MDQPGLFDAPYPKSPGWKAEGTSRAAAQAIKPRVPTLRDRVLALLKKDALSADECAAALGETPGAIRPRCSELVKMGLIYDTGLTAKNTSTRRAVIWRAWA